MRATWTFALALSLACGTLVAQESRPARPRGTRPVEKTVSGIRFTPPADAGWLEVPVTSDMRAAAYIIPHAEADAEDAELVVFFFRGQGGSVEDNLNRWFAQLQQPDGRPSSEVAEVTRREVNGFPVHEVDLTGTYVAETRPGSGQRVNKPGTRLLGAIVETPAGPFFLKLVGPDATVVAARERFRAFVETFRGPT
jgi:hypothetical protein